MAYTDATKISRMGRNTIFYTWNNYKTFYQATRWRSLGMFRAPKNFVFQAGNDGKNGLIFTL